MGLGIYLLPVARGFNLELLRLEEGWCGCDFLELGWSEGRVEVKAEVEAEVEVEVEVEVWL